MTSYLPLTIDGREIDSEAPRSQAMSDEHAQLVSERAQEFRSDVLHLSCDVTGRDVVLHAHNLPEGEQVLFSFGDGSGDVAQEPAEGNATAEHSYLADGVYTAVVYTRSDRAALEVLINTEES